jgi:hypothetical protein
MIQYTQARLKLKVGESIKPGSAACRLTIFEREPRQKETVK